MTRKRLSNMQLGIDATDGTLRVAAVAHGTVIFEVTDAKASAELEQALSDGSSCTGALPPASSVLVELKIPKLPQSKLDKILPSLLDVQLPFPLADCAYAFIRQGGSCVAHAARRQDVEQQIAALAQWGCNPARIVPPANAAWTQALSEFPPRFPNEPRAVFICDAQQTLLVTGRGAVLSGQTVFKTEPQDHVRRLKLAFGGLPEGLACILAGPECGLVQKALSEPVPKIQAKLHTADSPAFFLARALAFDAKNDGGPTDTNLRTAELTHPVKLRKLKTPVIGLCIALASSSAVMLALSLSAWIHAGNAKDDAEKHFQEHLDEVAGYPIKTKGERAVRDARDAMAATFNEKVMAFTAAEVSSSVKVIPALCRKTGVKLHHISLSTEGLTASGSAASEDEADGFVMALKESGFTATMPERATIREDGTASFFIYPSKK